MATGTMTSKGQITIPKSVRDDLGLDAGARVSFTRNADGDYVLRRERHSVRELAGSLGYAGPPRSIEEMQDAVDSAAAESLR